MIVYHGTTDRRAKGICRIGFLPKAPSKRVWFARSRGYASQRARTQARRSHDRAVVLTCDVNLQLLKARYGSQRVIYRGGIIAIRGKVPVSVLRSHPDATSRPISPKEVAQWVNNVLRLKPYKGVSRNHPGVLRLSKWIVNRLNAQPGTTVRSTELLSMARRWIPEFFEDVVVDPDTLHASPIHKTIEVKLDVDEFEDEISKLEEGALDLLEDPRPKKRVQGLEALREIEDPDLFDWCAMFLEDENLDVRVTAIRTMRHAADAEEDILLSLADSKEKRIRAAAITTLAAMPSQDALHWFRLGLEDPEPCVRTEVATLLKELDPKEHRELFELARYDPNPEIANRAARLTKGEGYPKLTTQTEAYERTRASGHDTKGS